MERRRFVIVGAGVGGLAAALRLAHRGEDVLVLEKTDQVGGRNRVLTVGGCTFDAGPTLVMMLDPFRRLFADVGTSLEEQLTLERCEPSYRVFYSGGERLEASSDQVAMRSRIAEMAGEREAAQFDRLLIDLKALYEDAIPNFVERNFYRPGDFFGPRQLGLVVKHKMLANLASRIERYFNDPRLRMMFSFQTMYLGLSPFQAPWVYSVLAYMEFGEGIWYPKGGVAEISRTIARLAESKGAEIRLQCPVARIEGSTLVLESGEKVVAETIVCNADLPYAERELIGEAPPKQKRRYSCSAFMAYIDYRGSLPELRHHNVFFGQDFRHNLDQIFVDQCLPDDPAFYAAISGRSDIAKADAGHENLYVLVPVPNLARPWIREDGERIQSIVFARLSKEVGFAPSSIREMRTFSPLDWRDDLNLDQGAAFGLSHDFRQSAYFRPANRSKSNRDVYFVGASTAPGNGLPMVLISAELLEQRLEMEGRIGARDRPQGKSKDIP